jgi:hypothetical protein
MSKFIILIFTLSVLQLSANGQCKTCNNFTDAFVDPEMVTAIKINSWQTDIELTKIPKDITKFVNIKTLWLSQHNFGTIGNEICQLQKLESLSLAEDKLTDIPDCIYEMKSLREIVLVSNFFTEAKKKEIIEKFKKLNPKVAVSID